MNSIYWLTRLDNIQGIIILFLILSIIGLIILIVILINDYIDDGEYFHINDYTGVKKWLIVCCSFVIINILGLVFIPNTKEACIIYGVGGTIDYIKQSKEAKQIPDKVVKALNVYLDNEMNKQDTIKKRETK